MTVSELIEFLKKQPQDLLVIHGMFSENCIIEEKDITVQECCEPRPDGWVAWKRPDKPTQLYLAIEGN